MDNYRQTVNILSELGQYGMRTNAEIKQNSKTNF